jgi:murein DD-endopeptidase MepM/ murein hydrolase activator NlpD
LHQASASVSQFLNRLANLTKSRENTVRASEAADPMGRIRAAAVRLAQRNGAERIVPIGVCGLLVVAAVISSLPQASPVSAGVAPSSAAVAVGAAPVVWYGAGDGPYAKDLSDIYLGDGTVPNTLQNPGVGTDANTLLKTYTVVSGDTLGGIATRFGLAPSTIYWANKASLPDPSALHVGEQLLIPPMDGLLVKVGAKDTLDSIAAQYKVTAQDIIDANNLPDATVVLGQTLLVPGASGGPIPQPKKPTSGGGGWVWPVGGTNYISQYFWSGHHAIDIAADYGTPVIAAVSGTVVMAGWRSYEGGGNVIWVMDGTKLYTTYNHLSAWSVHAGQRISAGQRIGSIGTSGVTTGPHLHFEVWLGYPWGLNTDSDAVNPCAYLAGC